MEFITLLLLLILVIVLVPYIEKMINIVKFKVRNFDLDIDEIKKKIKEIEKTIDDLIVLQKNLGNSCNIVYGTLEDEDMFKPLDVFKNTKRDYNKTPFLKPTKNEVEEIMQPNLIKNINSFEYQNEYEKLYKKIYQKRYYEYMKFKNNKNK
jgi:hypothetical protein